MNLRSKCALGILLGLLLMGSGFLSAQDDWSWEAGLTLSPGLYYNGFWDPGYNRSALDVMIFHRQGPWIVGVGAEWGMGYAGFDLLFPVKGGYRLWQNSRFAVYESLVLMPGMILSRPSPYFMGAAALETEMRWRLGSTSSLVLAMGPRITASPDYSRLVAPLEWIDWPITFRVDFSIP